MYYKNIHDNDNGNNCNVHSDVTVICSFKFGVLILGTNLLSYIVF